MASKYVQILNLVPSVQVVLNIGLDGPRLGLSKLSHGQRLYLASLRLKEVLPSARHLELRLDGDEPTLVVSGVFAADANQSSLLWDLLVDLEQDCCAILYKESNHGILFGPNADKWGDFDIECFLQPTIRDTASQ